MLRAATLFSTIALAAVTANPAQARDDAAYARAVAAVRDRMAPIDAQEDRFPGRVLVFTDGGSDPIVDARGLADVETGQKVDADTPFYIASMTKAFVGLMAVRLDAMGVMPLETTLAEAYPEMKVEGVDLGKVTMRHALSHRMGFTSPALSTRTAYTDRAPVADYARIVSHSHELTDPDFSYTNAGYVLYAGALEQRTGRSWKSWLDELVLGPLGMRHSSSRSSDLPLASHTHQIFESGWRVYPPKTDAIMHAAGGLVVSGADMARWLAANAGAESAIPAADFAAAHAPQAEAQRSKGAVSCNAYGFGWSTCEAAGIRFLEHGGTYTGARSEMIVLPDHGVGFAVMFNSDAMTGDLGMKLFSTFVQAYAGDNESLPSPKLFAETYADLADRQKAGRSRREAEAVAEAGQWTPDGATLAALTGRYTHPAFGRLTLGLQGNALVGRLNGTEVFLEPVAQDRFAARLATDNEREDFRFLRDRGAIAGIEWGDDIFTRDD